MDDGPLVLSNCGMVMPSKTKFVIILAGSIIFIVTVYIIFTGEQRAVRNGAERFIEAMMEMDFDTIYKYHAPSQKRIALAIKAPAGIETRMKEIYEEQKASFEQARPIPSRTDLKSLPVWSEKFLFIRDMNYRVTEIRMVEDIENPSLPIKERTDALVEVDVEYTNKMTAPDFGGRVKKVTYLMKLVYSRNVVRIWVGGLEDERWLFKSIAIKEGSVLYW